MNSADIAAPSRRPWRGWTGALAVAAIVAGCGGNIGDRAREVAAKVNKSEITVQQVETVVQQQRGARSESAEAQRRQVLERLIDQELAMQKAHELDLERDPRVQMQLEFARREILARAYADKAAEAASKPQAEDVQRYYEENPALFSQRRIYSIQEFAIEVPPDQVPLLRDKLAELKNVQGFLEHLKANHIRFVGNQAVRSAEQLPLAVVKVFAAMKEGQAFVQPAPAGAQVVVLVSSREQPVTLEQARPAIEQFLLNERRRQLLDEDRQALRRAARIQYAGAFAEATDAAERAGSAPADKN